MEPAVLRELGQGIRKHPDFQEFFSLQAGTAVPKGCSRKDPHPEQCPGESEGLQSACQGCVHPAGSPRAGTDHSSSSLGL